MMIAVIVCAAVAGVVGTAASVVAFLDEPRAVERHIAVAPRRQIADLAEGERACVIGTARVLEKTIPAALTARDCLYYIASIEERVRGIWLLVIRERRGVQFVVDDGSGHAVPTVVIETTAAMARAAAKNASRTRDCFWRVAMVSSRFIMTAA